MTGHSRSNSISDDDDQSVQMKGTQKGKEKAKRKRPPMKKRSEMRNHFTLLEDNPNKCKCNYYGRQYHYKYEKSYKGLWCMQDIPGITRWKSTKHDS